MPQRTRKSSTTSKSEPVPSPTLLRKLLDHYPQSALDILGFPRASSIQNREHLSNVLFNALVCAKLLGSRVPHQQAVQAADAFVHYDWSKVAGAEKKEAHGAAKPGEKRERQSETLTLNPAMLEKLTTDQLAQVLRENGFEKYEDGAAKFFNQLAENIKQEQGEAGDFWAWMAKGLETKEGEDMGAKMVKHMRGRVSSFKGLSDHAADFWIRVCQVYLSKPMLSKLSLPNVDYFPFMDDRTRKLFNANFPHDKKEDGEKSRKKGEEERRLLRYIVGGEKEKSVEAASDDERWMFVRALDAMGLCEAEKKWNEIAEQVRGGGAAVGGEAKKGEAVEPVTKKPKKIEGESEREEIAKVVEE
ncbi:uncharacterized protein VTP21DRAFT_6552 [Calcarisporiella thermophila]|uniref:uncharacterized protein n=1 Tax=Calcarisporiella thermophila TaxID=911321 RepID=UPI003742E9B5